MKRSFVVAAFIVPALLMLVTAVAWSPVAHAAPAAGTLTVNSNADTTSADAVLTLREALLIAHGGTGSGGLGRALTVGEKAQTLGCTFSPTNTITGGCGVNQPDTILFNLGLFANVITLGSPLPAVDDVQPTTVDGSGGVAVFIDAGGLAASQDGLHLVSDGNTVKAVHIGGAPRHNLNVSSANNTIQQVGVSGAGSSGIEISGNSNTLMSSTVTSNGGNGIDISGSFNVLGANLSLTNTQSGLRLYNSAQNNYIGCSLLCFTTLGSNLFSGNFQYGVVLTGTSVAHNLVDGNHIGINAAGIASQLNHAGGVLISGAHDNTIGDSGARANLIGGNANFGLRLDNSANHNIVAGNLIGVNIGNLGDGVQLLGGANHNTIGAVGAGNLIGLNAANGIDIGGAATSFNVVNSNVISGSNTAGIYIGGSANNNTIGSAANARNIICGVGDGIALTGSAYSNTIGYNNIGVDLSLNTLGSFVNGISLQGGANQNTIGGVDTFAYHNWVVGGLNGILISGSTTTHNLATRNQLEFNTGSGIRLDSGAHDNTLGDDVDSGYVGDNTLSGVLVAGGSHDNTLKIRRISYNGANGIEFTDAGTEANRVSGIDISYNARDGINERSGATNNSWAALSVYGNGGLGIDKNAPNDNTNTPDGPLPVITSAAVNAGTVFVSGTAQPGAADPTVFIELYLVAPDPGGFGEGKTYLGQTTVNGAGQWTVSYSGTSTGCYTAVETVHSTEDGYTVSYEFGPNSCRTFLPLIMR